MLSMDPSFEQRLLISLSSLSSSLSSETTLPRSVSLVGRSPLTEDWAQLTELLVSESPLVSHLALNVLFNLVVHLDKAALSPL